MKRARLFLLLLLLFAVTGVTSAELRVSQTTTVRCPVDSATYQWVVVGPRGRVSVLEDDGGRAIVFPSTNEWRVVVCTAAGKQMVVEVGVAPPRPDPDPQPDPDDPTPDETGVPADEFDNVGRLSFRLAGQLPAAARGQAAATGAAYRDAGERLADGRFPSIGAAAGWLQTERVRIWGATAAAWQSGWVDPLGAVYQRFVTESADATKFTVAKFYQAVAAGLAAMTE